MLAETICRIKKTGLMGIVRVETIERGIEIAQGCIDGGVDVLEISYTNNNAGEVIRALKEKFGNQLLVGAGTVLDPTTARLAIIKAFPISNYYGPDLAKVFKVPCPQIPILASGGANFDNLHTWFENGVDSVGLGGLLTKGSSADIAENARKLRAIVEESRKAD